jgi:hypothetical protein
MPKPVEDFQAVKPYARTLIALALYLSGKESYSQLYPMADRFLEQLEQDLREGREP